MPASPATRLLIGQFVAQTGYSIHTVRWYESQGLLPRVPQDSGGRRVYSKRHIAWIALMDKLRRSGMSIAQLREYTRLAQQGASTLEPTHAMLREHRKVIEEKIAEWQQALLLIDEKIDYYAQWIQDDQRPAKSKKRI